MYEREEAEKATLEYFSGDELATNVWLTKYALRDNDGNLLEKTPDDMHHRLAKEFARIEKDKFKKPLTEDEIYEYLKNFERIVPQGSPMYGIGNKYQYVSLGNCFVLPSPFDSYLGITYLDSQITQVSSRRGGCGWDMSTLRPKGMSVLNAAGSTTGVVSFMHRYSNTIREVAQFGRRGASLQSLNVKHPEILDFIKCKNDDTSITGSNISVQFTDEFMNAVINKQQNFTLEWPINRKEEELPQCIVDVKTNDIWNSFINNTWERAEPGAIFIDTVHKKSTSAQYPGFKEISSNPCQPGWAKVLTQDNEITTFNDIKVGDKIWSTDGWTTVIGKYDNGIKKVYRYYFGWNKNDICGIFEGTEDHVIISHGVRKKIKDTENCDCLLFDVPYSNIIEHECKDGYEWYVNCGVPLQHKEYIGEEKVFDITVDNQSHTYWTQGCIVSNCAEQMLPIYGCCRLISINLYSYVNNKFTDEAKFDFKTFYQDVKIMQRLADDMVDLDIESINRIIEKMKSDPEPEYVKQLGIDLWTNIKNRSVQDRRAGCGIVGLADCLAALNLKYDSNETITFCDILLEQFKFAAYESSIDIAEELKPFPLYNYDLDKKSEYIQELKTTNKKLYNRMKKIGRRNMTLLTVAPTGSVSLVAQVSSGIEPVFMLEYTRRKKINPSEKNVKVDFVDKIGDQWSEYKIYHKGLRDWMNVTGQKDVTKSPYHKSCAHEIDYVQKVRLQAAIQKHIDNSISVTTNLPKNISKEKVSELYLLAYKLGCKGFTIYRDGCRSGVLVSETLKPFPDERPKELECDVHHITSKGQKFFVLVGLCENRPYEIFAGLNNILDSTIKTGKIIKRKKNFYKAEFDNGDELSPVTNAMTEVQESISRLCSLLLRNQVNIYNIVSQLEKIGASRSDIQCFSACLARALKKYIQDGIIDEDKCECGGILVRFQGCPTCCGINGTNPTEGCGYSKCL